MYDGLDEQEGAPDQIRRYHPSEAFATAGDAASVSWHLDATCFGLESPLQVITWVALTDASLEAGYVEVIPSSHRLG